MNKFPEYQPGQAEAYLVDKGWKFRRSGDQLVAQTCPFCGSNDYKFFISNDKGLWDCKKGRCAKKGNFFSLLRELGDGKYIKPLDSQVKGGSTGEAKKTHPISAMLPFEINLAQDQEALDYLKSRGFTLETCQAWHFGVKEEHGQRWLMIPYLLDENTIADIKYRTLPPRPAEGEPWSEERKWKRLQGGESILFGEHLLDGNNPTLRDGKRVLFMTEGELDAVTLWQNGFAPAVSTTVGAGAWKPRYYDMITAYRPDIIYVVYDGDAAGQKGAAEVIKRFEGPDREVVNVVLPEEFKDSNKFFAHHAKEDFEKLLKDTEEAEIPNVRSLGSVLDELATMLFLNEGSFQGLESEFKDINELLGGGFRNGELITISGIPGVGKTTFVMQELLRQSEKNNLPTYLLCLEMPEYRMAQKIITHKFHIPLRDQTAADVQRVHQYLVKIPFFLGSTVMDLDHVGNTLRLAKKRHDIKAACFDNLNYFVRSTDKVTAEIALFTKFMKSLAVELDIPIFLIAQPRKFDDSARSMNIMDLKDSASIAQDSDVVILFYRKRTETKAADIGKSKGVGSSHSPIVLARVEKSRYSGGGEAYLYFDGARSTYRELLDEETNQEAA